MQNYFRTIEAPRRKRRGTEERSDELGEANHRSSLVYFFCARSPRRKQQGTEERSDELDAVNALAGFK